MKILTNKQYREALAEERDEIYKEQRIERRMSEINDRFWGLERRVNELEGKEILEAERKCAILKSEPILHAETMKE